MNSECDHRMATEPALSYCSLEYGTRKPRSAHLIEAVQDTHDAALDLLPLQTAGSGVHPYGRDGNESRRRGDSSRSGESEGRPGGDGSRNGAGGRNGRSEDSGSEHFDGRGYSIERDEVVRKRRGDA